MGVEAHCGNYANPAFHATPRRLMKCLGDYMVQSRQLVEFAISDCDIRAEPALTASLDLPESIVVDPDRAWPSRCGVSRTST